MHLKNGKTFLTFLLRTVSRRGLCGFFPHIRSQSNLQILIFFRQIHIQYFHIIRYFIFGMFSGQIITCGTV